MCRWHEIHSPTHSTVWCVGLLPPRAALRLNQEQICTISPLERWCAWRTGSGQASLWSAPCFPNTGCLCKALRVYFPCKHHPLEMGDFSTVECLKISQLFKRSCFPSCPPTALQQTCQSYSCNPGGDKLLLLECPAAHAAKCRWCTNSPEQGLGGSFTQIWQLPELLELKGLSGTEGSLWPSLLSMINGKRRSKRKIACFYLSCKKGRQDCAVEPAVYPLWLLTKSWQLLWFASRQTQRAGLSLFSYPC